MNRCKDVLWGLGFVALLPITLPIGIIGGTIFLVIEMLAYLGRCFKESIE